MLQIQFIHEKPSVKREIPYSEFPSNMPLTWYHICEEIECRFLAQQHQFQTGSGFLAIHSHQLSEYRDWVEKTRPFLFKKSGLHFADSWHNWLKHSIVSPFFEIKQPISLVLFRIPRQERSHLYNLKLGPRWLHTIRNLYSSYELVNHFTKEMSENMEDYYCLDKNNVYRPSYITHGFTSQRHLKRKRHENNAKNSTTSSSIDFNDDTNLKNLVPTKLVLVQGKQPLLCRCVKTNVHGILRREMMELNMKNYKMWLEPYDFNLLTVYQDPTDEKQYVLIRDMKIENEKNFFHSLSS